MYKIMLIEDDKIKAIMGEHRITAIGDKVQIINTNNFMCGIRGIITGFKKEDGGYLTARIKVNERNEYDEPVSDLGLVEHETKDGYRIDYI